MASRLIHDLHRWWKTVKTACGIQSSDSISSLSQDGCIKVTPEEKADYLNSVFAAQCSAPPSSTKPCLPPNNPLAENFFFARIEQSSVLERLPTLNVWKACGNDRIPNCVLKECAAAFAGPLTHIFYYSYYRKRGSASYIVRVRCAR